MADIQYPMARSVQKIPAWFEKIEQRGRPPKVTDQWRKSVGLTSSYDQSLPPTLRFVEFVDGKRVPTARWDKYHAHDKTALAEGIMEGYSALYDSLPSAHTADRNDIARFIRGSAPSLDDDQVNRAVDTFQALVRLADFKTTIPLKPPGTPPAGQDDEPPGGTRNGAPPPEHLPRNTGSGVVINVNLQLELPATTDPKVYDALFAALSKHILVGTNADD